MQFQLSCAAAAVILAVPAAAQQSTTPGSIPIYDITPQGVPTPSPTPSATPAPQASATPAPRPQPSAAASPVPTRAPARPVPSPSPVARATPDAAPVPVTIPTPQATYVGPVVPPVPAATATPVPVPAPAPATTSTPVVDSAPVESGEALPWWAWFLGGIAVAVGAALLFARIRRGRGEGEAVASIAPAPVKPPVPATPSTPPRPVPAQPAPPAPVVPPAPVAPTPGPFLEFQLAPLRVGLAGDRALLDFDLTVGNPAAMPVVDVDIATLLLTAHAGQDEQIAAFFAREDKRGLDPFALGVGERRQLEATMTLPRAAVNIVTARDRPFFVPMIAIDARYRWEDGRIARTTAAFMVGPAAPQGKLAPIFTDRGDRMTERLDVRLYGQVRRT